MKSTHITKKKWRGEDLYNKYVFVCYREKQTQAGPDGRLSGLSQHWTLALGAHETFSSTRNISQVKQMYHINT